MPPSTLGCFLKAYGTLWRMDDTRLPSDNLAWCAQQSHRLVPAITLQTQDFAQCIEGFTVNSHYGRLVA